VGANQIATNFIKSVTGQCVLQNHDLFAGQFNYLIKSLISGEVVKVQVNIEKRLNTEFFARLVPTHRHNHSLQYKQHEGLGGQVFLPTDSIFPRHKPHTECTHKRIFRDSMLRHNIRLGKKAIQRGLTVMLTGGPGIGKNSVAEELHDQLQTHQNFIIFNCSTVTIDSVKSRLVAKIAPRFNNAVAQGSDLDTRQGGTLYLDRIDLLDVNTAPILNTLLNRIIQRQGMGMDLNRWIIISSTEINDIESMQDGPLRDLHVRLSGFLLFLPQLKSRSDFRQLCEGMMASISPLHSLSTDAVETLRSNDAIRSLADLDWSVRTLLTHLPEGVIRPEAVVRALGQRQAPVIACLRCRGRVTKEARCLQIRQMIRQCNGNIALAARSLRVSRNTVYLHAPSKSEQDVNK
jgi:transcriptional regulator of acetoin/glycerol metabolism